MIDPLSEKAKAVAEKIQQIETHGIVSGRANVATPTFVLHDLLLTALRDVQQETREQDAAWMQHTPDCAHWLLKDNPGFKSELAHLGATIADCTCGLSTRLQEIQT